MQERKVTVTNDFGEKLVGLATIPLISNRKYPTIILAHGFDVTKEEYGLFDEIAGELFQAGFLVYRFDFSGCGESEGDYSKTTLTKLRSDLSTILTFVKSQPETDSENIGILGQSLGSLTTIMLEPKVQSLVLLGSPCNIKELLIRAFGEGYNPKGISIRKRERRHDSHVGPQFWEDLNDHKPLESIRRINAPTLFIHGEDDEKVPLSEMETYFNAANEPKKKVIIAKANHDLKPGRIEAYKVAVQWFKKYLQ